MDIKKEITRFWWVVAIALTVVGFFAFRAAEQNDPEYVLEQVCTKTLKPVWGPDGHPTDQTVEGEDCKNVVKKK